MAQVGSAPQSAIQSVGPESPERTVLRTVARALSLCVVRDWVEAESHAAGEPLLALGGQRVELGGMNVP